MKRRVISAFLILMGLLLIAYPKATELYNNYKQKKLILEWQKSLANIDNEGIDIQDNYVFMNMNGKDSSQETDENSNSAGEQSGSKEDQRVKEEKRLKEEYVKKNMEGILRIQKIKLYLPILRGATEKNLKISVASIDHTGKAGEIGNYAIAGHRNYGYGRNFNRLDEVEAGDIIEVDRGEKQYKYAVVEKLYVKPEDTWVLEGNRQRKEITLVTCHPMVNPTHRLIIKGEIIE